MLTENEKKLSKLYRRYQHAKARLEMGKENRDYAAIMAELKWQIDELTGNNNISDGIVTLKKIGSLDEKNNYLVVLTKTMKNIGKISYKTKDTTGILNYVFEEVALKNGYDLRALKLVFEQMKNNGIEKVEMAVLREDVARNNTMANMGARKNLSLITPYNEYTIKIK